MSISAKRSFRLVLIIVIATLWIVANQINQRVTQHTKGSDLTVLPFVSNITSTSNLSEEADYPSPVIQLQQLIVSGIHSEKSISPLSNNSDVAVIEVNENESYSEVRQLRQRLDALNKINHQN